jgi:glycosyltransferase involved in cell wall biosynthesis
VIKSDFGKIRISLVIPIYKNEDSLESLFLMLNEQKILFESVDCEFEPILVIDGSPDNCLAIILNAKDESLIPTESKIVELSRNFGQVQALYAGLEISTGNCSICFSADMQDPPELFLEMYKLYCKKNEIVLCVRSAREDSFFRNLTSTIGYSILRRQESAIPKGGFDFFLIGSRAKKFLLERHGTRRFLQGDLVNLGFSPEIIKYRRVKRAQGRSSYTFRKRLGLFADAFYDSSDLPIKLSTRFGFIVANLGFISAIFLLVNFWLGITPFNGFTALITPVLILGGIQLMVLGVIGEYIYRIFDITRNRPSYIVKNVF